MKAKLLTILGCILMATEALAENTKTISVTFENFSEGTRYAVNEKHDLGEGLVIYTTKCHFTKQLRIYSSSTNNGYVVSDPLPGAITQMTFEVACVETRKPDKLNVFGSVDGSEWTSVKSVSVTETSFSNKTVNFSANTNYTYFKLDVEGDNQIRIQSMSVTYVCNGDSEEGTNDEEAIVVSAPTFVPGSSTFTSATLDVAISATEGCEVYYTTDGSVPSYTTADEYSGTKGNTVTISASASPITIKAIAVDPTTGDCSIVSSATYRYVLIKNDGSKTKPYTVEEVAAMKVDQGETKYWVKGTIYGTMIKYSIEEVTTSDYNDYNMVIGDEIVRIPIQLPQGPIRDEINLKENPYIRGKEILIKGCLESYCGSMGVTRPSSYQISYTIPINSYGYATLFLDMPVSVPTGCTAYYCTVEGDLVKLLSVGSVIPANVGVIIEYTPETECSFTYTTVANSNEELIRGTNQLIGFITDTDIADTDNTYYALNVKDEKVGFYIPKTINSDGGFTAKANKAYLSVPAENHATMYLIQQENAETAIVPITHIANDVIYDLQGRIVSSPVMGIYIKAGKKVIIR